MTGFGSADGAVVDGRVHVEIRTVNHRYFNPQFKLPSELAGVEGQLRDRLRQLLDRGHVAVSVRWLEPPSSESAIAAELAQRLDALESGARVVEERAPARLVAEHERLKKAVSELAAGAQVDQ